MLLNFFTKGLGSLSLLTIIINFYEPASITLFNIFLTFITSFFIVDFGFGQTFSRLISQQFLSNINNTDHLNYTQYNSSKALKEQLLIYSIKKIYIYLTIIFFLLISIFGTWAVSNPINQLSDTKYAWIAWIVIVFGASILMYLNQFNSISIGLNLIAKKNRYESYILALSFIIQILFALMQINLLYIISVNILSLILVGYINYRLIKAYGFNFNINNKNIDLNFSAFRNAIVKMSMNSGIGIIFQLGLYYFLSIFIANSYNPNTSSMLLSIHRYIQGISSISRVFFYSKIPLINSSFINRDMFIFHKIIKRGMFLSNILYIVFVLITFKIFHLFNDQNYSYAINYFLILTIATYLERYGAMHLQVYTATNKIIWHKANFVSSIIPVLLIISFERNYGYMFIPFSLLVGYTFYSIYCRYYSQMILEKYFIKFEFGYIFPFLLTLVFFGFLILISEFL